MFILFLCANFVFFKSYFKLFLDFFLAAQQKSASIKHWLLFLRTYKFSSCHTFFTAQLRTDRHFVSCITPPTPHQKKTIFKLIQNYVTDIQTNPDLSCYSAVGVVWYFGIVNLFPCSASNSPPPPPLPPSTLISSYTLVILQMKGFGSKSIVSPLKIGKKEKAASQMREMRETCDDGKRGDEPLRLTVHKLRKEPSTAGIKQT